VLIEDNVVRNNRPNPVQPDEDVVGLLPAGSGIVSVGADRVVIRDNLVLGNDSFGVAVSRGPSVRAPDGNRVEGNVVMGHRPRPGSAENDPVAARTATRVVTLGTAEVSCR
jgi:hypothetical protein